MGILICPNCHGRLQQEGNAFVCKHGHSFDLSASGYLHLLPSSQMRAKIPGDNKQMVRARRDFLAKGYYQPISDLLNQEVAKQLTEGFLMPGDAIFADQLDKVPLGVARQG